MSETRPKASPVMWLARIALLGWAGFWLWFTLSHAISPEDYDSSSGGADPNDVAYSLLFAIPILVVTLLAWIYPRIGGVALILAAGFAAWYFDDTFARLMLALPPGLIGVLLLAIVASERRPDAVS